MTAGMQSGPQSSYIVLCNSKQQGMIILQSVHNRVQWVRVAWLDLLCWQHAPVIIDTLNTSLRFSLSECVWLLSAAHTVLSVQPHCPNNILFILSAPTNHGSADRNLCERLFITRTERLLLLTMCVCWILASLPMAAASKGDLGVTRR